MKKSVIEVCFVLCFMVSIIVSKTSDHTYSVNEDGKTTVVWVK